MSNTQKSVSVKPETAAHLKRLAARLTVLNEGKPVSQALTFSLALYAMEKILRDQYKGLILSGEISETYWKMMYGDTS